MADQKQQNGGNGDDASHVFDDMTVGELAKILLEDHANMEKNLSQQMNEMDARLSGDIGKLEKEVGSLRSDFGSLRSDFGSLRSEFGSLRMEVHQNQSTFIKNHEDLERRVTVLDTVSR